MQIGGLFQWVSCEKVVKLGKKRTVLSVTHLITKDYESRSNFAYLRPTLLLDVFTRVLRGT